MRGGSGGCLRDWVGGGRSGSVGGCFVGRRSENTRPRFNTAKKALYFWIRLWYGRMWCSSKFLSAVGDFEDERAIEPDGVLGGDLVEEGIRVQIFCLGPVGWGWGEERE